MMPLLLLLPPRRDPEGDCTAAIWLYGVGVRVRVRVMMPLLLMPSPWRDPGGDCTPTIWLYGVRVSGLFFGVIRTPLLVFPRWNDPGGNCTAAIRSCGYDAALA